MNDMSQTIIPKSDQLNADDLIGREMTIKITGVTIAPGEQPVSIHFEGDNGKPYKACKSMCRVMVSAWGPDSKKYVGRSMTIYRDPKVKWAGMEVGGIRISHMSHIGEDMTMALTVTRANKKPFTVRPLTDAPTKAAPQTGISARTAAESGAAVTLGTHSEHTAAGAAPSAKPASPQLNAIIAAIEDVRGRNSAAKVEDMIRLLTDDGEREFATTSLAWQVSELKKQSKGAL